MNQKPIKREAMGSVAESTCATQNSSMHNDPERNSESSANTGSTNQGPDQATAQNVSEQPATTLTPINATNAESFIHNDFSQLSHELAEHQQSLRKMEDTLLTMETMLNTLSKQVALIPPQVRLFGNKIDGLSTSVSETRLRSALLQIISIGDLIEHLLKTKTENLSECETIHYRNYEVIHHQLLQVLESNGLQKIPTNGDFDPAVHRAVKRVVVSNPAQHGKVVEVIRIGLRTEQIVLRYADVCVGFYESQQIEQTSNQATGQNVAQLGSDVNQKSLSSEEV